MRTATRAEGGTHVLEGGVYRPIRAVGISEAALRFITEHPMPVNRDTLIGRVGLDGIDEAVDDQTQREQ